MNDFIHCNKCFALPDSSGKKFLLTSCSHIFCYSCSESVANERICLKCKNRCNLIQLDSSIKPDIKMYFEPLDKLIVKLTKIEKFQRTHREHLLKHLTSETSKGNQAQEKWDRKMSELKKEINHLRSKLNNRYDPIKMSSSSVGYYSRPNSGVLGPSRQGTSSSRLQCNSTFGSLRGAPLITPLIDHRITNLDQRSNASSKITLRSLSDLSSFQNR